MVIHAMSQCWSLVLFPCFMDVFVNHPIVVILHICDLDLSILKGMLM